MTELDFDRDGFPHKAGSKSYFTSPEDTYTRYTVLPLMRSLESDQLEAFEDHLIDFYSPEITDRSHITALAALKCLPMEELVDVANSLESWITSPVT